MEYEVRVKKELAAWEKKILCRTGILEQMSRGMQKKIDSFIPPKIHKTISKTMEVTIKSILAGINLIPVDEKKLRIAQNLSLAEVDCEVDKIIKNYKKVAAATGAGTGWGGLLGLAVDYPALISLELKMLQEIALAHGYDINLKPERTYLLKVFILAFSADSCRKRTYLELLNFQNQREIDWQQLYHEYKERVEFKKMLQIIPGFGAVVGAWANYGLITELGETARNAYRLRYFKRQELR
ncbi:MAG: EcsC family protein [Bacillota bacterium]